MKRMVEVLRTLFGVPFWREFVGMDMCEEARMIHEGFLKKE